MEGEDGGGGISHPPPGDYVAAPSPYPGLSGEMYEGAPPLAPPPLSAIRGAGDAAGLRPDRSHSWRSHGKKAVNGGEGPSHTGVWTPHSLTDPLSNFEFSKSS